MKKIFLFLLLTSLVITSCNKDDDNNNNDDSDINGIWNVIDTYVVTCAGLNETKEYTYQITIESWKTDSIVITNLNEETPMYGFSSGSSIVASQVNQSFSCESSGIVDGNKITFTLSGYECDNLRLYQYLNSNCQNYSIDNRVLVATKQ